MGRVGGGGGQGQGEGRKKGERRGAAGCRKVIIRVVGGGNFKVRVGRRVRGEGLQVVG